jgi:hypothetical protein
MEKNWPLIEKIIKVITPCVPIIAVIIGLIQFERGQTKLKDLEYQKIYQTDSLRTEQRLLEKKIDVYTKISEYVGALLAKDTIDSIFKQDAVNFNKIYYGEALLIMDSSVNKIIKRFKNSIDYYIDGDINIDELKTTGFELSDSIKMTIWRRKTVYR